MLAVAARWTPSATRESRTSAPLDTIRSDYENRRVLAALVRQEAVTAPVVARRD
jgi:hypothetical protein